MNSCYLSATSEDTKMKKRKPFYLREEKNYYNFANDKFVHRRCFNMRWIYVARANNNAELPNETLRKM